MVIINESIGVYTNKVFERFEDKEALVYMDDGRRFTFKELNYKVNIIAKSLISIGVKKGDHVALLSANSPEWIIIFLAVLRIGGICVCLNYSSTEQVLDYMLRKSESTILLVNDKDIVENINFKRFNYLKLVLKIKNVFNLGYIMSRMQTISDDELNEIMNDVLPDDVGVILYTSGSTGNPKGVMLNHRALLNGTVSFMKNFNYTDKDTILACMPLHHILGGEYTAILGLLSGSTIVLMRKFKTSMALEAIEKEKCTGIHGVPTMYRYLLNRCSSYDTSSLRVGMVAGGVSSESLMKEIMENLHISQLNNTFGQTETLGVTQTAVYSIDDSKINTVGKPVEGVEIKICDIESGETLQANNKGELYVKSPYIMNGYYNEKEETKRTIVGNWVRTGDIALIDDDGYLSIKGRLKDLIIKSGENISPADIENCLIKNSQIESAVVVGVPDEFHGEEIFAFIKPYENLKLTEDNILEFLSGKIEKYKSPKYMRFVDSFPLTSNGKVDKNMLKQIADEQINGIGFQEVSGN